MQPMRRPSCRIARSMIRPRPSTQKRRLLSRSALGMTGMHDFTCTDASCAAYRIALTLRRAGERVVIQYPTRAGSFKRLLDGAPRDSIENLGGSHERRSFI